MSEPRREVWAGLEEARGTLAVPLPTGPLGLPQGCEAESAPSAPGDGEREPLLAGREARGALGAQSWARPAASSGRGLGQPEAGAGQARVGQAGSQGSGAPRATLAWLCSHLGLGPPSPLGFLRFRPGSGGAPAAPWGCHEGQAAH